MCDFGYTQYTDHANGKKILLKFPEELLRNTAVMEGIDIEHLNQDDAAQLFTKFVNGWLSGKVATEDLSSLANFFLTQLKDRGSELAARLMDASELSYYVRRPNKESGQPLYGFVIRLQEFVKEQCSD